MAGRARIVAAALLLSGVAAAAGAAPKAFDTDIVVNGGFEDGRAGWTESAGDGEPVLVSDPSLARAGSGVARLGHFSPSRSASIHQSLSIPAFASRASIRFWYRIATEGSSVGRDHLAVRLLSTFGSMVLADFSSTPTNGWVQSPPIDVGAWRGRSFSLTFFGDFPAGITSYLIDDVTLTIRDEGLGANYTGLWWNPDEPGWGIGFSHQGGTLLATLYSYDSSGEPMWLVMPGGRVQREGYVFTGTLLRARGPAFDATPFGAVTTSEVGSMTVSFAGDGTASLRYSVSGQNVSKIIQRQVFGARAAICEPAATPRETLRNYQDLWWNPAEPGWGLGVAHQDEVLFGTLFTYDRNGRDLWLAMPRGERHADGSYGGDLYRTRGGAFNASPFPPLDGDDATPVGTMRLSFADGTHGTLAYTYAGARVVKPVTRQLFASPAPACR